jgi:Ca2+-binding RTX toxin-like protein
VTDLVGTQNQLTVASYNVLNLDINDDPSEGQADQDVADGRLEALARQIINNLGQPDIIGLQEVQDNSGGTDNGVIAADQVLQALVDKIVELGGPSYSFIDNTLITNNTGGGQPGANIRNVFLYNDDRVDLVEGSVRTTTDAAADFAGSRLPLVATFTFNGEDVTIINNHFSSKGGSTPLYGTTQPSVNGSAADRLVQAQNVADYVTALGGAKVVVLGDLNEFSNEESLAPLSNAGMTDMVTTLDPTERYTYSYEGNAQVLDHIFVSGNLSTITEYDVVHVNTEFAHTDATASDHDPSVIAIQLDQISFTGTELADYLVGNGADNELFGLAGDDRLFGGAGDDIMHGGAGNDIYYVDSAGDRIVEGSREGTDLVFSTVDYSLMGAHVEYLSLIGDADIAGTGNNQANAIAGNDGDNIINGMGGADVLTGRGGADMFLFTMKPTATNIDRITDFTVADDTIGLDRSIFRAGPAGELRDFNFHVGAAAADAQDRIIYNDVTGDLMYDADGTGSIAAVVFARIDPGLALTHADFVMI